MKIKKQHILVSALILALGAAVYLNWQFSGVPLTAPSSKELGAAAYVSKDTKATADDVVTTSQELSPEKIGPRKYAIFTVKAASQIENRIIAQSNIESILSSKGFSGALCFASGSGCTVTVKKEDMKDDSPLIIKDAVLSQLDVDFNNITIVEL